MRTLLPIGVALIVLGAICLLLYEGWAVGMDNARLAPSLSDYLQAYIASAPGYAVLFAVLIGCLFTALIIHLFTRR